MSLTGSRSVSQARLEDTELQPGLVLVKPQPPGSGTRWRVDQETGDLGGAVLKGIKIQCYKGP